MKRWRLIVDGALPGIDNMTVDRAMQISRSEGTAPPTLRLYRWQNPTVSLGHFQPLDSVDLEVCAARGVGVVRRFTGGRGVLHDQELTYSVVASVADGMPQGTAASYRLLSTGLAAAYALLGVAADLTPREGGEKGSPACYLHTTGADLSREGRKLSGSAQVWLRDSVLQHGSLVIRRDVAREAAVFRLDSSARSRLASETVTLVDALGTPPSVESMVEAVVRGFGEALGVEFERGKLSEEESRRAQALRKEIVVRGITLKL